MRLWRLFPSSMESEPALGPLAALAPPRRHAWGSGGGGGGLGPGLDETAPLLDKSSPNRKDPNNNAGGLGLVFATLCIVDLFGVFPIVALPRPIIDCGWVGLPLAAGVFLMQIYTALLLGRCWVLAEDIDPSIVDKSRYPYAALAHMTMGRTVSNVVSFLLEVTIFGAGVPNLLVASQNIQLFGLKMSDHNFDVSFCYWLIILGIILCPIMWLGSPKDMKWLVSFSVCTVCCVAVLTWTCMLQDESLPQGFTPVITPPSWEALAIAYGIIAFQFDVHPMILTVQVDMKEKNKLGKAIVGSFVVTGALFLVTTGLAFWKYGPALRYNLLQGLPAGVPLYVNLLLVTTQICLSMVVGGSALFQDIEDKLDIPRDFSWKRCALRSAIVLVSVVIGEAVPRFDLVMGLIGGSLTGPLMFILPPLFYAKLRVMSWETRLLRPNAGHALRNGFANGAGKVKLPPIDNSDVSYVIREPPAASNVEETDPSVVEKAILRKMLSTEQYPGDYQPYRDQYLHSSDSSLSRHRKTGWFKCSWDLDFLSMDKTVHAGPLTLGERTLTVVIVFMGTTATLAATYFSVRDTLRYATFTPPCLVNVTQASKILSILTEV